MHSAILIICPCHSWRRGHFVETSTTDPRGTAARLTCSEYVPSTPFHVLSPIPEYGSERGGRLAGKQGGWVQVQRENPQGTGPVRVTIVPGQGSNVVNVFRNSGSKTSSLSLNMNERKADVVGTTIPLL